MMKKLVFSWGNSLSLVVLKVRDGGGIMGWCFSCGSMVGNKGERLGVGVLAEGFLFLCLMASPVMGEGRP